MTLSMRRIGILVRAVALMAAILVATAMPALADKGGVRGHCTQEGSIFVEETCAGGSGGPGGGGGGRETTLSIVLPPEFGGGTIPLASCATGGSGGPGGGGGGNTCR